MDRFSVLTIRHKKGAAQTALTRWWGGSNRPDTSAGWLNALPYWSAGTTTCVKGSTDVIAA